MKEKKITLSSQIELLLFIKMRFCFRNEIISDGLFVINNILSRTMKTTFDQNMHNYCFT